MVVAFRRLLLVVISVLMMSVSDAHALWVPPPTSWTKTTRNARFIFVMLLPKEWMTPANADDPDQIRAKYPKSGLYRNDGSNEPLWTVDWYAREWDVEVASDGIHLIYYNGGAHKSETEALSFNAKGKAIRTRSVRDLMSPAWQPQTNRFGLHDSWAKRIHFDDDRLTFTAVTDEDRHFVFDVRSEELIEHRDVRREGRLALAFILAVVLVVLGMAVGRRFLRRQRSMAGKS